MSLLYRYEGTLGDITPIGPIAEGIRIDIRSTAGSLPRVRQEIPATSL